MILRNCPHQYKRIINNFLTSFAKDKCYLEKDAFTYIERLNQNKRMSLENHRLHTAALKWYYQNILGMKLNLKVPYRKRSLPNTLSFEEVQELLKELPQRYLLLFQFMYGLGMKIGEVLKLRIKNVDINNGRIFLDKDREYKIPMYLFDSVKTHYKKRQKRYIEDKKEKNCFIPKENRGFSTEFHEQPFFASQKRTKLKAYKGLNGRQFIDPSTLHVYISQAQNKVKFNKRTTCMTLRHSFALYQLQNECSEVVLKEYLGHTDIRQTLNYKKLIRKVFFTPYEMLQDTGTVNQIKELIYLQRYPSEQGLREFIQQVKKKSDSKIAIAENDEKWQKWLVKAKEKKLNFIESASESDSSMSDYIFLDLRKLSSCKVQKKIRTIQALFSQSRKKLLICSSVENQILDCT
ncbi:MAG: tyrosine-type recombinase/integrase [Lentisphaeraceae bacterium]|nr:tyrosine-type recombinase/integrase [Lentisphaeraceae bacterium]